jgi:hypothetical protein
VTSDQVRHEKHEVVLKVGPYANSDVAVSFEPSGMMYELVAGDWLSVVIKGHGSGLVEIGHTPSALVIGAWAEADTEVWTSDGHRLEV